MLKRDVAFYRKELQRANARLAQVRILPATSMMIPSASDQYSTLLSHCVFQFPSVLLMFRIWSLNFRDQMFLL